MTADVTTRLAAGDAALGNIGTYVEACAMLGRAAPDLTAARVREWYGAEAGLRLDALESDTAAVESLARALDEAVTVVRSALGTVLQAWKGEAGFAGAETVDGQCASGDGLVDSLRATAGVLRSLREQLGQLVDEKVATTLRVDDSRMAEHPAWLPQARALLRGVADSSALDALAQQIGPYVDGDIQGDWLPAMRSSTDSVAAAYDDAVARMSDRPASAAPSPAATPPQPVAPSAPPPAPWGSGLSAPALPGLPDLGGGLPTLVAQIADILGSYADVAPESGDGPEDLIHGGSGGSAEPEPEIKDSAPQPVSEPITPPEPAVVPPAAVADPAPVTNESPAPAEEAPVPPVPPPLLAAEVPAQPAEAPGDPRTPCAIAADELPQVGQ